MALHGLVPLEVRSCCGCFVCCGDRLFVFSRHESQSQSVWEARESHNRVRYICICNGAIFYTQICIVMSSGIIYVSSLTSQADALMKRLLLPMLFTRSNLFISTSALLFNILEIIGIQYLVYGRSV